MKTLSGMICIAIALVAADARAQVSEATVDEARRALFNGRAASLVYVVGEDDVWNLTSVFSQPFSPSVRQDPYTPRRWVLRRQFGRRDAFSGRTLWADSTTCPEIEGVLWSLTQVQIPSFDVPGITPVRPAAGVAPTPVPTHGPVFVLWGTGEQPSGAIVWVRAQPFGGELAQWGLDAERHLAGCWAEAEPAAGDRP